MPTFKLLHCKSTYANVESAIFPWLNFIPIFLIGFRPAIEHNKLVIFQFNYHLYRSSVDLTLIQYTAHIFADSHLRNIHRFNLNVIPVWMCADIIHALTLILGSYSNVNALRHANHTGSARICRFLSATVDFVVLFIVMFTVIVKYYYNVWCLMWPTATIYSIDFFINLMWKLQKINKPHYSFRLSLLIWISPARNSQR